MQMLSHRKDEKSFKVLSHLRELRGSCVFVFWENNLRKAEAFDMSRSVPKDFAVDNGVSLMSISTVQR